MSMRGENTKRKRSVQEPVPYVMKMHKRTGTLYLERERPGFYQELPYVAMLVFALAFALVSSFYYIQIHTEVACRDRQLDILQQQILELQDANADREDSIFYNLTLGEIYRVATQELGMVPATEENILFFEESDREFVYQTEKIPDLGF